MQGESARPSQKEPRRRRKDARPGEIIEAAMSLWAEKGFAATRLDDIAAEADSNPNVTESGGGGGKKKGLKNRFFLGLLLGGLSEFEFRTQ